MRHWGQIAKVAAGAALVAAAGLAGGCQFKGAPAASAPAGVAGHHHDQSTIWRPRPVRIAIYPSTRFVKEQGKALLLANVRFLDAMGDPIKGVGRLRCELFAGGGGNQPAGQRLYRWDVNLLTLADQKRYYDPITRGYLLRLGLDNFTVAKEPTVLRVMFIPASGGRLVTHKDLPLKW